MQNSGRKAALRLRGVQVALRYREGWGGSMGLEGAEAAPQLEGGVQVALALEGMV